MMCAQVPAVLLIGPKAPRAGDDVAKARAKPGKRATGHFHD
jgi:hypothetical protein